MKTVVRCALHLMMVKSSGGNRKRARSAALGGEGWMRILIIDNIDPLFGSINNNDIISKCTSNLEELEKEEEVTAAAIQEVLVRVGRKFLDRCRI